MKLQGNHHNSPIIFLADLHRSAQLDSLSIDNEIIKLADQHAENVLQCVQSWPPHNRTCVKAILQLMISLLSFLTSSGQTIGMRMMGLRLNGRTITYTLGRTAEIVMREASPLLGKLLDLFNTVCFIVFLGTGRYTIV